MDIDIRMEVEGNLLIVYHDIHHHHCLRQIERGGFRTATAATAAIFLYESARYPAISPSAHHIPRAGGDCLPQYYCTLGRVFVSPLLQWMEAKDVATHIL